MGTVLSRPSRQARQPRQLCSADSRALCLPCSQQEIAATPILTPWGIALRWENPASTTHSLTPSPSNRPLIFWILTPCEKPVATGSAGRCEPGVGRFTGPHPLTCFFFTPPFCSAMFGLYEQPLQARLGLLFPFLPFFFPPVLSSAWMGLAFSHPGLPLSWIRSQLAHTGPTGRVCCFAGVVPLPGPQSRTQGHTGASLVSPPFSPGFFRR